MVFFSLQIVSDDPQSLMMLDTLAEWRIFEEADELILDDVWSLDGLDHLIWIMSQLGWFILTILMTCCQYCWDDCVVVRLLVSSHQQSSHQSLEPAPVWSCSRTHQWVAWRSIMIESMPHCLTVCTMLLLTHCNCLHSFHASACLWSVPQCFS